MGKMCTVCGKRPAVGSNVSNSQRHTKRKFNPNLQRIRVRQAAGGVKRQWVCTSCIRADKIAKA
ncbi:MAG TPA: 50S ribosomal protein L28 [Armatimonadetes bacterium]|nr:50S ribosomal protein L28 [Armatimonadota bacterium]